MVEEIHSLDQLDSGKEPDLRIISQRTGVNFIDGKSLAAGESERRVVSADKLPVSINVSASLLRITGIGELLKKTRDEMLGLEEIEDVAKDGVRDSSEKIIVDQSLVASLMEAKPSVRNKYLKSQARIEILLEAISKSKETDKEIGQEYELIERQLQAWQALLAELIPKLLLKEDYQQLLMSEVARQKEGADEVERLRRLITGERVEYRRGEQVIAEIDEKDDSASKLRERLKRVLLANTDYERREEVVEDSMEELTNTALLVNEIRIIERFKDEGIDLMSLRAEVEAIKKRVREAESQAERRKLSEDLIELVVPIANLVGRIFPHEDDESPTLLSAVLYHEQAVCVGKAQILATIFRLLGLKARNLSVLETLYNSEDHSVALLDLFDQTQLVVDANFSNNQYGMDISCHSDAEILIYRIWKEGRDVGLNEKGKFNLYEEDGQRCRYSSNSLSPHKLVSPDIKDRAISSSDFKNSAHLLENNWQSLGLEKDEAMRLARDCYEEAKRLNPNHGLIYNNYANLLVKDWQSLGLGKEKAMRLARDYYEKAKRLIPNHGTVCYNYAIFFKNNWQSLDIEREAAIRQAEALLKKAIKREGEDGDYAAWFRTSLAQLLERNGKSEEAATLYQEVLDLMEEGYSSWMDKGKIRIKIESLQ